MASKPMNFLCMLKAATPQTPEFMQGSSTQPPSGTNRLTSACNRATGFMFLAEVLFRATLNVSDFLGTSITLPLATVSVEGW